MKTVAALLLTMALAACGSPPTHFYTLTTAPPAAPRAGSSCRQAPVSVRDVMLPGILDRESIVRMGDTQSVDIAGQDRWAAPLDGMIQHVVAEDLRQRLPPGRVLLPGDATPAGGAEGLTVNIGRFAGDTAGHVTLQADWSLIRPSGGVVLIRSETIEARAASGRTEDVVAAMSHALGTLTDHIAAALQGSPR